MAVWATKSRVARAIKTLVILMGPPEVTWVELEGFHTDNSRMARLVSILVLLQMCDQLAIANDLRPITVSANRSISSNCGLHCNFHLFVVDVSQPTAENR